MQEWLNWPLSKSGIPQGIEGSNPSPSAISTIQNPWTRNCPRGSFVAPDLRWNPTKAPRPLFDRIVLMLYTHGRYATT